ncbi:intraflagellar transport protein 57 homolog [Babylonia areolata]|uniref:intraflagellar transport protein 57 homolog n=1 Tax=Babylonia areolata TaxID=304850 RepID=UPI003FD447B0
MAEEGGGARRGRGGGDEDGEVGGPGLAYMPYIIMEELADKLRLLDYDRSFLRQLNVKPISRHYFAVQTNPGEQFYMFTSIAAWLLRTAGKNFDQPQEYDDPNATISSILDEVRKYGHTIDFPPSKLKQGWGEHCIYVLDRLADETLIATGFKWKTPQYPEEEAEDDNVVEDDSELNLNEIEKTMIMGGDDDEEDEEDEPLMDLEGMKNLNLNKVDVVKKEEIMESTTDAADWRLEVERVTPQLKVTIRTDNKDWRVHLEQMHQHRGGIESSLTETQSHLDKLHNDIAHTLEKIASREKYLNHQLEHLLGDFRKAQDQLAESKEKYRQASGGVTERSRTLADVTEELEKTKQEMEERGSSMTDGAPLVKIKQAIQQLKKEIVQMDIRSGVVEHVLLQAKLKDKTSLNKQVHTSRDDHDF